MMKPQELQAIAPGEWVWVGFATSPRAHGLYRVLSVGYSEITLEWGKAHQWPVAFSRFMGCMYANGEVMITGVAREVGSG